MSSNSNRAGKRPLEMEGQSKKVVLMIVGSDGAKVTYRVNRDMTLQKVLRQYCEEKHLEYLAMDFYHNGGRVPLRRTPAELRMEDGEEIEAFVRVGGGGVRQVD